MKLTRIRRRLNSAAWIVLSGTLFFSKTCIFAATHNWTGAVNGLWSNTNNWTGGSAPGILETPPVIVAFPSGVSRTSVTNDVYNGFFGALRVDSLFVLGNNYHFYGIGGGTNLVLTGNLAPVLGVNFQNLYCPATNITFDGGMNLILQNTNTITNSPGSTLDIQASLTGSGGWTFQGLGTMTIDGSGNSTATGICDVVAGNLILNRDGNGSAIGGSFMLGTVDTTHPANVSETNCPSQFFNTSSTNLANLNIAPSGTLTLCGDCSEYINTLTMTGGVVSLATAEVSEFYVGTGPANGVLVLSGPLNAQSSPSGTPARITGHMLGANYDENFNNAALVPYWNDNPYGMIFTNTFNVISGSLVIDSPIVCGDALGGGTADYAVTIIKTGAGTLVTTGTNTCDGGALIEQGIWVAGGQNPFGPDQSLDVYNPNPPYAFVTNLMYSGVVVSNGAQLVVASGFVNSPQLVLNGFGTNGTGGALNVQADGAQFLGGCTFATDASIVVTNPQHTVSFYDLSYYSPDPITGTGAFYKSGPGTVSLIGQGRQNALAAVPYVGTTYLNAGNIIVSNFLAWDSNYTNTFSCPVIIGTNGSTTSSLLELQSSQCIVSNVSVTINSDGVLTISGTNQQTFNSLNLNGGTLGGFLGGGTAIINGGINAQAVAGQQPTIWVNSIALGSTNQTFTVGSNTTLGVIGTITDGGSIAGLTKTGPGELDLYSANYYNGLTVVGQGILGFYGSGTPGSTFSGTVVSNLAAVNLYDGVSMGSEPLSIIGNGPAGAGSIVAAGSNSWAGNITLTGPADFTVGGHTEFSGGIGGVGGLLIQGNGTGTALLDGTTPNTFTNQLKVLACTVALSKTNAIAVAGPLVIGENLAMTNYSVVQLLQSGQISSNSDITVTSDGLLALSNGVAGSMGSLAGSGNVSLGTGSLLTGLDNVPTSFGGNINGSSSARLAKVGNGVFTLTGTNGLQGATAVGGGTLMVNGSLVMSSVTVSNGATLCGNGSVGPLIALNGATVAPGNSVGTLYTTSVTLNSATTVLFNLNGTNAGTGYSQLVASGPINLGNAGLKPVFLIPEPNNSHFTVISNASGSAISSTFLGLPEGATMTANNGAKLSVTYQGGSTKNAVLTQTGQIQPQIGFISGVSSGVIQLSGTGMTNLPYSVWANSNLASTNWLVIGSTTANGIGVFLFTDPSATNYPQRFYRLSWP